MKFFFHTWNTLFPLLLKIIFFLFGVRKKTIFFVANFMCFNIELHLFQANFHPFQIKFNPFQYLFIQIFFKFTQIFSIFLLLFFFFSNLSNQKSIQNIKTNTRISNTDYFNIQSKKRKNKMQMHNGNCANTSPISQMPLSHQPLPPVITYMKTIQKIHKHTRKTNQKKQTNKKSFIRQF